MQLPDRLPERSLRFRLATCLFHFAFISFTADLSPAQDPHPPAADLLSQQLNLTRELIKSGSLVNAASALEELARRFPEDPRPNATLCHVRYAQGDVLGAMDAAVASLRIRSTTAAWNNLIRIFHDREEYPNASFAVAQSMVLDASESETWAYLARIHAKRNLLGESEREYAKAIHLAPHDIPLREEFAWYMLDKADSGRAMEAARQLLEIDPGNGIGLMILGRSQFVSGEMETAVSTLLSATGHVENTGPLDLFLGEAFLSLKQRDKARMHLQRAASSPSVAKQAHFALGRLCREEKNTEQASEHARKFKELGQAEAKAKNETLPELFSQIAQLVDKMRIDEALPLLKKTLELHPHSGDTHMQLAFCYVLSGSQTLARHHLSLGERLSPFSSDAYSNIGAACFTRGQIANARACWEKALFLNPHSMPPLDNLAKIELTDSIKYLNSKGVTEALSSQFPTAVSQAAAGALSPATGAVSLIVNAAPPQSGAVLDFSVSLQLALRNDIEGALEKLEKAADVLGRSPKLGFYRCVFLSRLGRQEEALEMARQLGLHWSDPVFEASSSGSPANNAH